MARPGWPERNKAARSFRQLRRFHHVINSDKVFGTHSHSPNTTTWSRHSRRIEPISRSAYPFCHGERGDVGRSRMPIDRSRRMPSEGKGHTFESCRVRHFGTKLGTPKPAVFALEAATSARRS